MAGISGIFRGASAGLLAGLALTGAAAAQSCDTTYVTQEGDSLTLLAERVYGEPGQWSLIYYANITSFTGGPTNIPAGTELVIPCVNGAAKADPAPLHQAGAELRFVTAALPPLLTDPDGTGGGMITELVNAAMEATPNPVPYEVTWEADWATHPARLDAMQADMGFPWAKPDCAKAAPDPQCSGFHWSDPVFVLPIQLFVTVAEPMAFTADADLEDRTLCLPEGDAAPWLDAGGRNLLADGHVTVTRAADFGACLDLLLAGDVDAVPEDIFSGVDQVYQRGLRGKVTALERPIGTESLHVVISRQHWRGTTHLYRVNAGLAAIKASGRYDEIVNRHLGQYMAKIRG